MKPTALVMRAAGTNCDRETAHALERAGFEIHLLHVNRLLENRRLLHDHQLLAIPGGFSYGDDISAGRILANQIMHHLAEPLHRFVEAGKPILGVCNGFQVLIKTDLLPGAPDAKLLEKGGQTCTLTDNDGGRFLARWVHVAPKSQKCIWTADVDSMELPIAHGEGKFICRNEAVRKALHANDQIAMVYTCPDRSPADGVAPFNPNGSIDDIAGVCDTTGLILGLMPHPERFVSQLQHPAWSNRRLKGIDPSGDGPGLQLFQNAFRHVASAVGAGI